MIIINTYYTKQELETAQTKDIISCLNNMGYQLVKEGSNYYRGALHNSLVIKDSGRWFWNSQDISGNKPVELLKQILMHDYGYDTKSAFITAIKRLAGTEGENLKIDTNLYKTTKSRNNQFEKSLNRGNFILPPRNINNNKAIHYLCNTRGLDREIVAELIAQNKIYETKNFHNVCFVSYDKNNIPRHGFLRGTYENNNNSFKKDIENSDKSYGFILGGNDNSTKVFCFESSIDTISHASLYKMNNMDYKDVYRVSLHCTSFLALERFLKDNPQIEEIVSCLDNDETGIKRTKKLCKEFSEQGYKTFIQPPTEKDYNQQLLKSLQKQEASNSAELELE